ncbi:hypothetical protein SIID45300_02144 [Candidatus Magnetaquicoccaceae bacterium FCR-1]|uniref:DUF262 domain-containing protein n=1 Tax=Candidatus Magnetaquiglobus chichijimensis TaxID=3141448 RepID=A0ABQ0CA91_9PROT
MDAQKATLLQLVDGNKQFRIPIYQRTYSWRQEQCSRLLDDVLAIAKAPPGPSHFIGSVVYVADGNFMAASVNSLLVIDGQQRLTTLSLMLLALRKRASDGVDVGASPKKIGNLYLFNGNEEEESDDYIKLQLTRSDKDTYRKLCLDHPLGDGDNNRVQKNYLFFLSAFESGRADPAEAFVGIQRLQLVYIALELGKDNPQLIFESMNSTGLDLAQADLIRNFVLMGLPHGLQERIYNKHWFPMESRFGQQYKERFDGFMRTYLTVLTGSIPREDEVYAAFKKYVNSLSPSVKGEPLLMERVAADLDRKSAHYAAIAFGKEQDAELHQSFHDIATLRADVAHPFLLELYGDWKIGLLKREDLLSLTKLVESYVFRRFLCGMPTNSMNKTFAGISKRIDKTRYFRSAQAEFLKLATYRKFPSGAETAQMLEGKDVYNTPRCAYMLERLENHFHPKEPVKAAGYTIEHVMPQRLSDEWRACLGENADEVHSRLLHTLGNLTLTGYNSELSYRPFQEKLEMREGGFLSSPLALNRRIREQKEWGKEQIQARGTELAAVVLKVWPEPDPSTLAEFAEPKQAEAELYDLDHYPPFAGAIRGLYLKLEERLLALHPAARRECKKLYVAFKFDTNFVDVIPLQSKLVLVYNMAFDQADDPKGWCRDITNISSWGNGDVEMSLSDERQIDYAVGLAEQSLALQMQE